MKKKLKKLEENDCKDMAEEFFNAINDLELSFNESGHLVVNIFLNFFRNHKVNKKLMRILLHDMAEKYAEEDEE